MNGLHRPSASILKEQYIAYLPSTKKTHHVRTAYAHSSNSSSSGSNKGRSVQQQGDTAALADVSSWLAPPKSVSGNPLPKMPFPVQALAESIEQHLRSSFLQPYANKDEYKRVAGALFKDYVGRVGQQLQQAADKGASGLLATMWAMAKDATATKVLDTRMTLVTDEQYAKTKRHANIMSSWFGLGSTRSKVRVMVEGEGWI